MEATLTNLAKALLDGTATDEDREQLRKMVNRPATVVKQMTAPEYLAWANGEIAALSATPDAFRSELLSKAAGAVADLGEAFTGEATVNVEVLDASAAPHPMLAEVVAKVDQLMAMMKNGSAPAPDPAADPAAGDPPADVDPPADPVAKAESIALQLAAELLNAYVGKITALKAQIDAGGVPDNEEIWASFDGYWDVRDALSVAATAMGKRDESIGEDVLKEAQEQVATAVDAVKAAADGADDPPADADPAAGDGDGDGGAAPVDKADPPDECPACGAKMAGKDECPNCAWKVGDPVEKRHRREFMDYNDLAKELGMSADDDWEPGLTPPAPSTEE